MRRKKQAITDIGIIEDIIQNSKICKLGLSLNNQPYIVPLNFGYEDNVLYLHSAISGRKIDIIRQNNNVCFEMDTKTEIVEGKTSCHWTMHYQSVIGFGKASIIEDNTEKAKALKIIVKHYSDVESNFPEAALNITAVIKVKIETITAKQNGYLELSQ